MTINCKRREAFLWQNQRESPSSQRLSCPACPGAKTGAPALFLPGEEVRGASLPPRGLWLRLLTLPMPVFPHFLSSHPGFRTEPPGACGSSQDGKTISSWTFPFKQMILSPLPRIFHDFRRSEERERRLGRNSGPLVF